MAPDLRNIFQSKVRSELGDRLVTTYSTPRNLAREDATLITDDYGDTKILPGRRYHRPVSSDAFIPTRRP